MPVKFVEDTQHFMHTSVHTGGSAWLTPGENASTLNLMSNSSPSTEPASEAASCSAAITSGWAVWGGGGEGVEE